MEAAPINMACNGCLILQLKIDEMSENKSLITVRATINAPLETVWKKWTTPTDIEKWNNASEDWHTPHAENDLKPGGKFLYRMEAKDGSFGFDFEGIYSSVKPFELIEYTLGNDRNVKITFGWYGEKTTINEAFEAESENSLDMQKTGWQSILDNFKKYVEAN
jgi:uncharacterized protein YndB with AHSA1/START domain